MQILHETRVDCSEFHTRNPQKMVATVKIPSSCDLAPEICVPPPHDKTTKGVIRYVVHVLYLQGAIMHYCTRVNTILLAAIRKARSSLPEFSRNPQMLNRILSKSLIMNSSKIGHDIRKVRVAIHLCPYITWAFMACSNVKLMKLARIPYMQLTSPAPNFNKMGRKR